MSALTNEAFTHARQFKLACQLAGVQPTRRQASKFRNKKGSAYAWFLKAHKSEEVMEGMLEQQARLKGYVFGRSGS